jgi:hypothetical protein
VTKPKRCKLSSCRQEFVPARPMQAVCGPLCGLKLAREKREKAERRDTAVARLRIKTRAEWQKEAQVAFNAWVRARDARLPCISCGRHHQGQLHAGHFLSTGARPNLRFDPANVHKQCQPCNTHLHGNLVNYRINLIQRIGLAEVERLEADHAPRHYTVDQLKAMKREYAAAARALTKEAA